MVVKWLGHEADHLLQFSIKVGNEWSCTFCALYMLMVGTGTLLFYMSLQVPLLSSINCISNIMVCYFDPCMGRFYSLHMHSVLSLILGKIIDDRTPCS